MTNNQHYYRSQSMLLVLLMLIPYTIYGSQLSDDVEPIPVQLMRSPSILPEDTPAPHAPADDDVQNVAPLGSSKSFAGVDLSEKNEHLLGKRATNVQTERHRLRCNTRIMCCLLTVAGVMTGLNFVPFSQSSHPTQQITTAPFCLCPSISQGSLCLPPAGHRYDDPTYKAQLLAVCPNVDSVHVADDKPQRSCRSFADALADSIKKCAKKGTP